MTLYIVGYFNAQGALVLIPCPTYVDALLRRAALLRMGVQADIVLREVDRVPAGRMKTMEVS